MRHGEHCNISFAFLGWFVGGVSWSNHRSTFASFLISVCRSPYTLSICMGFVFQSFFSAWRGAAVFPNCPKHDPVRSISSVFHLLFWILPPRTTPLTFCRGPSVRVSIVCVSPCLTLFLKKVLFYSFFLLTLFDNTLKYQHVSQKANINRQQAEMTFQFACRKWLSHKDLEPAGPDS